MLARRAATVADWMASCRLLASPPPPPQGEELLDGWLLLLVAEFDVEVLRGRLLLLLLLDMVFYGCLLLVVGCLGSIRE